jgi:hypothetical protein
LAFCPPTAASHLINTPGFFPLVVNPRVAFFSSRNDTPFSRNDPQIPAKIFCKKYLTAFNLDKLPQKETHFPPSATSSFSACLRVSFLQFRFLLLSSQPSPVINVTRVHQSAVSGPGSIFRFSDLSARILRLLS